MKPLPITFTDIQQIKDHQFVGNHYHDSQAFDAIDRFVQDDNTSIADKAEALRQMQDRGMGCGRDEETTDEVFVETYLDSL
jgi:CO dehydrogenase/acetyl-CoA synthase epsilon subunit